MKNKVILVGFSGFIGSKIKKKFSKENILCFNSKNLDLKNKAKIKKTAYKFNNSILIYAAGKKRTYGDTFDNFQNNINFFFNILSYFLIFKPKKVIFLSSVEVYGEYKGYKKISEITKTNPKTLYSQAKLIQEEALKYFAKLYKFEYLIVRIPGVYGKDKKNSNIISKLILSSNKKYPFKKFTSGNEFRDYIYVNDVARFVYDLVKYKVKNLTINLATGKSYKINKIIILITKNLKRKLHIKKNKANNISTQYNLHFDNKLIKKKIPSFKFTQLEKFDFKKEFYNNK